MTFKRRRRRWSSRNFDEPQYVAWRDRVRRRDGYRCQWPGCKCRKRLHVHHIRRWADNPLLRFMDDNGITLCYNHHEFIRGREEDFELTFARIVLEKKKSGRGS